MKIKYTLSLLTLAILAGCNSGGGDKSIGVDPDPQPDPSVPNPDPTNTLSGYVINGYISNAEVFLDKNFNGLLDVDEESTLTDSNGFYSFDLPLDNACVFNAPIVANITTSSYDETKGEQVTEAYTLASPPYSLLSENNVHTIISPLTTMLWHRTQYEYLSANLPQDCSSVNVDNRDDLYSELVEDSEGLITNHYGITVSDIYMDYSSNNNMDVVVNEYISELKYLETVKTSDYNYIFVSDILESVANDGSYHVINIDKESNLENEITVSINGTSKDTDELSFEGKNSFYNIVNDNGIYDYKYYNLYSKSNNNCTLYAELENVDVLSGLRIKTEHSYVVDSSTSINDCTNTPDIQNIYIETEKGDDSEQSLSEEESLAKVESSSNYDYEVIMPLRITSDVEVELEAFASDVKTLMDGQYAFNDGFNHSPITWQRTHKSQETLENEVYNVSVRHQELGEWNKFIEPNKPNEIERILCFNTVSTLNLDNRNDPFTFWNLETDKDGNPIWIDVTDMELQDYLRYCSQTF